ncbi:PQQ-binding-like beta-propeller repeat protein [Halocatena marina]|uniref:PQQ-binding-like beta-propeller repeat protein n=1 Tax=Halocatena marina TaxID=2934937 RepID=UPI002010A128|nr:PQQ-binding-like beta-propeller repeat protein [Halocatena marina]
MVPDISRRRVLTSTGAAAGLLPIGTLLSDRRSESERQRQSSDWPMERHDPAGTGYAPNASGPKHAVSVRWKQRIETSLGAGYKPTPIVADGLVYGAGQQLICADTASGETVFRTDRNYNSPPTIARSRAYRSPTLAFSTPRGAEGLHAHGDQALAGVPVGRTRWSVGDEKEHSLLFGGQPSVSIPVASNGIVFVISNDTLHAIDASSGRVRWQREGDGRRPAVRNGTVYVTDYSKGVFGYDIETGKQTFSATPSHGALSVTAAPTLLIADMDSRLIGLDYEGTTVWRYNPADLSRDGGPIAVADGVAYAGFNGNRRSPLVAIDTVDGTERWRSDVSIESTPQFAPPAIADGVIYIPVEDEGLTAIDTRDGSVLWQFVPSDRAGPGSPAALADGTLYTLGSDHLYALEEA